jgi:hypothetical protein
VNLRNGILGIDQREGLENVGGIGRKRLAAFDAIREVGEGVIMNAW